MAPVRRGWIISANPSPSASGGPHRPAGEQDIIHQDNSLPVTFMGIILLVESNQEIIAVKVISTPGHLVFSCCRIISANRRAVLPGLIPTKIRFSTFVALGNLMEAVFPADRLRQDPLISPLPSLPRILKTLPPQRTGRTSVTTLPASRDRKGLQQKL